MASLNTSKPSYLLFKFDKPVEVASLSLNAANVKTSKLGKQIKIEVSDDGVDFKEVGKINAPGKNLEIPVSTGFKRSKAKYVRLKIPMALKLVNVRWSASPHIKNWTQKANYPNTGYHPQIELNTTEPAKELSGYALNPGDVIDISQHMDVERMLDWEAQGLIKIETED